MITLRELLSKAKSVKPSQDPNSSPAVLTLKRIYQRTLPDGKVVSFYRDDKTKIIIMFPPVIT